MHEEISISEWEAQPFDAFKLHICETIRQLDEAVGRPPFPNPSTEKSRSLAQRLLCMLQYVHKKNLISSLSKCPEVNMTFPVLCASLKSGSEGECPCPVLMQLFLESLICVHSVSLYPPQTTLKDAKMVLPTSPVSFRLFAVTGAMDVDNMLFFFFGMVEPEPKTKVIENKPTNGGEGRKKISKKNIGKNDTINVSRDMLMVALDVVLPSECTELLLSLFNSPSKFQQIVGSDSELASRVLAVFHDSLPKLLSPLSLLRCLDVYILDTFIDVVKVHGDNMTLLITESVFTEIPLAEWSPERFTRLIRYCVQRKVRREEALPSLVVYVFLYKLVVLWGKARTFKLMHIEEELKFWEILLSTAKMIALRVSARPSTRKGNEEAEEQQQQQQVVQALSGVAEYIKQQYTIIDVRNVVACGIPHASVKAVLDVLITLLLNVKGNVMVSPAVTETSGGKKSNSNNNNKKREKHQTNTTTGTNKNNKKNNNANKHNNNNNVSLSSSMVMQDDSVDLFCKWISESFAFLFWLMPSSAVELPINNVEGILESLAALLLHLAEKTMGKLPQVSTWESYLNFIISAIVVWEEKAPVLLTGQKFASSLFLAVKATHRVECCGIIAERMPETYTSLRWSLHDYNKILLNAWLQHGERGPSVESFYAPVVALSSTEYIGILLNFLDDHQINELAQLLLKTEQKTVAFISLLNKALQEEPISSTTRIADGEEPEEENEDETVKKKKMRRKGLLRLQNKLLSGVDDRSKMLTEQKQRDEETRKVKLLMEVQRREELVAGAMAFEKELQKHREMKDEKMRLIEEMREERRREKEMRLAKERQERQERRQKAIEILQEMNAKTKAEREAEQRERLLRYRERVTMDSRISSFLEQLHLPSSRIMRLLATLRPHILDMTHDDVLEFVVTGRRKVPSDMHAVDEGVQNNNNNNNNNNNDNNNDDLNTGETSRKREEKKKTACFADEAPSFWDSVMQLVAHKSNEEKRNGDAVNAEGEYYDENPLPEASSSSFSFHRRVSVVLDLFDYSMGTNETLPNPLPSLNVRSATRVLDKEALVGTGFCNAREALLACQQRGLCVLRSNTCTLQPLGFRYHYPFHNPKQLIDIQLEERRKKVREMMAKQRGAVDVEACEGEDGSMLLDTDDETDYYDDDDDVVRFTDELV